MVFHWPNCQVPCDKIPMLSWPLFRARALLQAVIASIKGQQHALAISQFAGLGPGLAFLMAVSVRGIAFFKRPFWEILPNF